MALGGHGETVGTAFVRILADGTGFPESVRKEVKDSESTFTKSGEGASKAFDKGFDKQEKKNKSLRNKKLVKSFDEAFGAINADAATLSGGLEQKIKKALIRGIGDGLDPKRAEQVAARAAKSMADGFARNGVLSKNIRGEIDKALNGILKDEADFEKQWRKEFNKIEADTVAIMRRIGKAITSGRSAFVSTGESIRRLGLQINNDLVPKVKKAVKSLSKVGDDKSRNRLLKFGKGLDKFGNKFAAVFGGGGRNDFFNIIGKLAALPIEGLARFTLLLGKAQEAGGKLQGLFANGFSLASFGKLLGGGIAGLIAMGVVIFVLISAMGVFVSLLSGVTAAIIGLAAAVTSALVGGLAAFAGLLLPLVASIGVLGLAFSNLDLKARKALADAVRPFSNELKRLRKTAQEGIFDGILKAMPHITDAFKSLRPLVRHVSDALGSMIGQFAKSLDSPGFRGFAKAMTDFLPGAIKQFGRIVTNVIGSIGNIFEVLVRPGGPVRELGKWIEDATLKFRIFTGSADGKNKIKTFFDDAWTQAKRLLRLIGLVGEALGLLLFGKAANKTGGSIIDDLSTKVQSFIDYLKDPKHAQAIKDFFKNGLDTARNLGTLVLNVATAIASLDTPENRKNLKTFFTVFNDTAIALGTVLTWTGGYATFVTNVLNFFERLAPKISDLLINLGLIHDKLTAPALPAGAHGVPDKPVRIAVPNVKANRFRLADMIVGGGINLLIVRNFGGLGAKALAAAGKFYLRFVIDTTGAIAKMLVPFVGIGGKALHAAGKFVLRLIINPQGVVNDLLRPFSGTITRIQSRVGKLALRRIVDATGLVAAVVNPFFGLGAQILKAIGSIDIGSLIHLPSHLSIGGHKIFASGGLVLGPQFGLIGEAGPEAIVPLKRPLSQVDPAVRALSAFAQGKGFGTTTNSNNGRSINVGGLTIVTPTRDPAAVARETINRLAGAAY